MDASAPSLYSPSQYDAWFDELEKLLELPSLPPVKAGELQQFGRAYDYRGQTIEWFASVIGSHIKDALSPAEFGIRRVELGPEESESRRVIKGIHFNVSHIGLYPVVTWYAEVSPLLVMPTT